MSEATFFLFKALMDIFTIGVVFNFLFRLLRVDYYNPLVHGYKIGVEDIKGCSEVHSGESRVPSPGARLLCLTCKGSVLIVKERLVDLFSGIHHEWPVTLNGLIQFGSGEN